MNREQEFDRRIADLHGIGRAPKEIQISGEVAPMDVRHAEFEAMADVFLGAELDSAKRKRVEELQVALHRQQAVMYQRLVEEQLSAEKYVDDSNALIEDTFRSCEEILGAEDFEKLFGATRFELSGLIDRETFLGSHVPPRNIPPPCQAEAIKHAPASPVTDKQVREILSSTGWRFHARLGLFFKETLREKRLEVEALITFARLASQISHEAIGPIEKLPAGLDTNLHACCKELAEIVKGFEAEVSHEQRQAMSAATECGVSGFLAAVGEKTLACLAGVQRVLGKLCAQRGASVGTSSSMKKSEQPVP